jgi:hypothetical protein
VEGEEGGENDYEGEIYNGSNVCISIAAKGLIALTHLIY